jgi:hypothetical protein
MGRGNVCVTGRYEGLFYIDNEHIHVYRRDDPYSDEPETRLMGSLSYEELTGGDWLYDEWGTGEEEDDILECFMDSFGRMFPSFSRVQGDVWIKTGAYGDYDRRVIMDNSLFYIAVQDNQWSVAVELIQKEDPYDNRLSGLQARHYQRYLEGMKKCLLERLPSIGTYGGAWTSGCIKREELAG